MEFKSRFPKKKWAIPAIIYFIAALLCVLNLRIPRFPMAVFIFTALIILSIVIMMILELKALDKGPEKRKAALIFGITIAVYVSLSAIPLKHLKDLIAGFNTEILRTVAILAMGFMVMLIAILNTNNEDNGE